MARGGVRERLLTCACRLDALYVLLWCEDVYVKGLLHVRVRFMPCPVMARGGVHENTPICTCKRDGLNTHWHFYLRQ